ncbi:MAG: hypothetical protein NTX61_02835 [Bacteroidetes bacterium]|nr:hypothetical protein [Bacteroidota bacterium]
MKYSDNFKKKWWIIILVLISILIVLKSIKIINPFIDNQSYDLLLLIIWFILILYPLIGEIDIFGVKLKKEIEEVKTKMFEIKAALSNTNTFNPIVHFHGSRDEELEDKINHHKDKSFKEIDQLDIKINEKDIFLLQLRKALEKELRRIFTNNSEFNQSEIRFESVINFIENLRAKGIINTKLYGTIKELVAICNLSIHGEEITEKQLYFAHIFAPTVLNELRQLK